MGNGVMAKGPQATAPILDSTTADGALIHSSGLNELSSQIVEIFRRKLELGRKHIILQMIDGSCAGNWQHNR
jgi:hypothetical protein